MLFGPFGVAVMIKQICGTFDFYNYTFRSPDGFILLLSEDTVLDVSNCTNHFDFSLKSTSVEKDQVFYGLIHTCAKGIGFLLDVPIFASYSMGFTETVSLYDKDNLRDRFIFERIDSVLRFDQTLGNYRQIETEPQMFKFRRVDFEQFISQLKSNGTLESAVNYYLNAIDEPGSFLVSLYKAYEILKNKNAISKTDAKKFTHLANDPAILIGRHASSEAGNFRLLTSDEDKLCHDVIRYGIICYADRCVAEANKRTHPTQSAG